MITAKAASIGKTDAGRPPWGFNVVALFDSDPDKVGSEIADITIDGMDDLERVVKEKEVAIGIVATPASAAQEVARSAGLLDRPGAATRSPACGAVLIPPTVGSRVNRPSISPFRTCRP